MWIKVNQTGALYGEDEHDDEDDWAGRQVGGALAERRPRKSRRYEPELETVCDSFQGRGSFYSLSGGIASAFV